MRPPCHVTSLVALVFACLVGLSATPVRANLTWEKQIQVITPAPTESAITTTFHFTNTGTAPLTIESIKTSCGCTLASLEKREYAPGESGDIAATLTFKRETVTPGEVEQRHIYVSTSGVGAENYVLTLGAKIVEYVRQSDTRLVWQGGDATTPRTIDFKVLHDQPIHLSQPASSKALFTASLETIKDGSEYRLTVTPTATDKRTFAEVTVASDFPATAPFTYKVDVGVVLPTAAAESPWYERAWLKALSLIP